ncbi:alpha-L-fucosidase [Sphingobacterium sp. E70]|uniref:alpha-L-fucosidase n=1 Tax=Sphingobacterium sp. E70 TaxID=2853439 RepID=UPI00211CBB76|nr:alpha-L-fucosidase [Sphingobacterium sp. E70]
MGTKRILKDLLKWQPDIIVNNRFWNGLENKNGDIGTPEKYIPPTGLPGMDWEVSHTMNESYGFSNHDSKWKSYDQIMRLFLETVSKGGNFLLNVGPDAAGTIPEPAVKLLHSIGDWMKINGESIYGTTASPFQTLDWGYCTQKNDKLYFHVFDRPKDGQISVPLASPLKEAYLLQSPRHKLSIQEGQGTKIINIPENKAIQWPQVIVAKLIGPLKVAENAVQTSADGRIVLTANNAKLQGSGGIKLIGATTHDPNRPNAIGNWSLATDQAYWDIKVQRPGSYNLVISYLPNKKMAGTIEIALGDQKISHKIPSGDENKFIEKEIGVLEIDQRLLGETNVKLKLSLAEVNGDQLPEISSIILVPRN